MIKYTTPLSNELYCTYCKDIYENPCILICGHTFCLKCIQSSTQLIGAKCPRCHHPFKSHDILPDTFIRSLLHEQTIRCQHPQCGWEGTLSQYRQHYAECPGIAEFSYALSMAFKKSHRSTMKRRPMIDIQLKKKLKDPDDVHKL